MRDFFIFIRHKLKQINLAVQNRKFRRLMFQFTKLWEENWLRLQTNLCWVLEDKTEMFKCCFQLFGPSLLWKHPKFVQNCIKCSKVEALWLVLLHFRQFTKQIQFRRPIGKSYGTIFAAKLSSNGRLEAWVPYWLVRGKKSLISRR